MRKMVGLQFKFSYKKGSENKAVDTLSSIGLHFNAVLVAILVWVQEVINSYHNDCAPATLL
jgi:hypothetical protein